MGETLPGRGVEKADRIEGGEAVAEPLRSRLAAGDELPPCRNERRSERRVAGGQESL